MVRDHWERKDPNPVFGAFMGMEVSETSGKMNDTMIVFTSDHRDYLGEQWRSAVFSEIDYGFYAARETLGVELSAARGYMLRTEHWKYAYFPGFSPQLFDLVNDPDEFVDLGRVEQFTTIRTELTDRLFKRLLSRRNRLTMTDETVANVRSTETAGGIMIGKW